MQVAVINNCKEWSLENFKKAIRLIPDYARKDIAEIFLVTDIIPPVAPIYKFLRHFNPEIKVYRYREPTVIHDSVFEDLRFYIDINNTPCAQTRYYKADRYIGLLVLEKDFDEEYDWSDE